MNANVNRTNRIRLYGIRKELFNMANSYAGDEHGHIACRLHGISNSVHNIRDIMEVLYPLDGTPAESRYGREPEWTCPRCGYRNAANNEVCMGAEMGDGRCGKSKPNKVKPLAQYLDEYIEHEAELNNICAATALLYAYNSWRELLEQALDAYESTENVKIRIEKV